MATLNSRHPTLADVTARFGQDGKIIHNIVEILSEKHDELEDMVVVEANGVTEHTTTVRGGLPDTAWRRLYKGIPNSKSTVVSVKDSMGELGARALVDEKLLNLNGNSAQWLMSEEAPFIESMGQKMADTLWYEDGNINPERFMGFAPRFSNKSAENGRNIIDAGGEGADNASIWLVVWGVDTVHCIYPKGTKAGLQKKDMGIVTVNDDEGNRYEAHESKYVWENGLCVRDWRYVVRIANIDVKKLDKTLKTGPNLPELMVDALELVPNLKGRPAFYMNRTLRRMLRAQIAASANHTITQREVGGKLVTHFGDGEGVPVRVTDSLLSTEARVK